MPQDKIEENNSIIENVNIENHEQEETTSYDFLDPKKQSINNADIITTQFDTAFKNSSPLIQEYILGDKLEENVKLICKIEKLDEEKARVIIENITISILVGLLPISIAKETLIESFRSSGILLEPFSAGMIMRNIDAYILSDIRKQILENKIEENKEIRHLTLKEKKEEAEKEELRKILLERTGNLTGKGAPVIQYKEREIPQKKEDAPHINKEEKKIVNRESLLEKINLKNISNVDKIKERMKQIKDEEIERLQRVENKKEAEIKRVENIKKEKEDEEENKNIESDVNEESLDLSKEFANSLKEKILGEEEQNIDLDTLREERAEEEKKLQKEKNTAYSREISKEYDKEGILPEEAFDPYRETI